MKLTYITSSTLPSIRLRRAYVQNKGFAPQISLISEKGAEHPLQRLLSKIFRDKVSSTIIDSSTTLYKRTLAGFTIAENKVSTKASETKVYIRNLFGKILRERDFKNGKIVTETRTDPKTGSIRSRRFFNEEGELTREEFPKRFFTKVVEYPRVWDPSIKRYKAAGKS